jgi:hypothetical protein
MCLASRRSARRAFWTACLVVGCCLPAVGRADTVYVVSKSNNKLLQFDSASPATVTTLRSDLYGPSALAMGGDGNLYIAEWGDFDTIDPRISRYDLATGSLSVVVTLDWQTQSKPTALAFRPAAQGGEMLVGRLGSGPILKVGGWAGSGASVSDYTTGYSLAGGLGLAVSPTGTLYVSNSAYAYDPSLGYAVASGPIVSFDSDGAYANVTAAAAGPGGLAGPTGLVLEGSTLYSASVMNGKVFATDLSVDPPVTSLYRSVGYQFEVGPLAMLSDGTLLVGSVSGVTNTIYSLLPGGGTGYLVNADFGQVGGIVAVSSIPAVPELGGGSIAACGIALVVSWIELRRVGRRRP